MTCMTRVSTYINIGIYVIKVGLEVSVGIRLHNVLKSVIYKLISSLHTRFLRVSIQALVRVIRSSQGTVPVVEGLVKEWP